MRNLRKLSFEALFVTYVASHADGDLECDERPGLLLDAAGDGLRAGEHHGVAPVLRRGHVQVQAQATDQD